MERHNKQTSVNSNEWWPINGCRGLTIFPQLNGNMSAIVDISKNSIRQVMSMENSAENIINRRRPNNGNRNSPTCTVPAEHSVTRHAAEDN